MLEKDSDYEHYLRLRALNKKINSALSRLLHKKDIARCAKDLGRLQGKALVLNNEDDLMSLFDYCIHNPRGKKSCIDAYMERASFDPESDEFMILKALRNSFFSIFQVMWTEKDYLCHVNDMLRDQDTKLLDVGLGSSASPGTVIAARLITVPGTDYYMTTGAPMLVREKYAIDTVAATLRTFSRAIDSGRLTQNQANAIGKRITRALMEQEDYSARLGDPEEFEHMLHRSGVDA